MKKYFTVLITIVTIMTFFACSNNIVTPEVLRKEGVAPYKFSASDTYLLQSLGLDSDTNIVSFLAPKSAKSLEVNAYVLDDDGTWNALGGVQVPLGQDDNLEASLEGNVAMLLEEDNALDIRINTMGCASYKVGALDADYKAAISAKRYLTDFQAIEINKEIPVAVMIYDSGTIMRAYEVDDYFTPSEFEGMDIVQAVTLTFADTFVPRN